MSELGVVCANVKGTVTAIANAAMAEASVSFVMYCSFVIFSKGTVAVGDVIVQISVSAATKTNRVRVTTIYADIMLTSVRWRT